MPEFTEQDAYEIINTHFIEQLKKYEGDSIIFWNNRQLKKPEFEHTFIRPDKVLNFCEHPDFYPIFISKYWKKNKIKDIILIEWNEYNTFFKKNDSIDLEALWDTRFNGKFVHNVSFPIYNTKTKIAVIRDYNYRPFLTCGTGLDNLYHYEKTENGWVILK
ncbi:hypothetical protein CXF68_20265 [Tenacibaculum sp. Bg11-29]|uniref:hypothetical protein n=1 Tax=Tenacibaculum sp. Bg11-29 TaxID=2058306 RepID=UPI000C34EB82|nr:hypothetical protein [Tenacibaculum sp. Bg11-29]PKH52890.1 hypothetical protein CXF68_20265 [Tenacibaculum sp. Bg11-29]